MTRMACGFILMAIAASVIGAASPVTILYTNDVHMRWDRFASMADFVATERESGTPVLLFDAGDTWQDHRQPIQNVWGSHKTIAWMNEVSYTAMAVGNHDTYMGSQRLLQLIARTRFPVLSANWRPVSHNSPGPEPSIIIEIDDLAILVIGLTTPEFLPIPAYPGWQYSDTVDAVRDQISQHADASDFAFVVGHISIDHARRIARHVPEIDVIISGHSHERTIQPVREGHTLIVQSGAFGQTLGRLRLELNPAAAHIDVLENDLLEIEKTPVDVRAGVLHLATVLTVIAFAIGLWIA